MLCTGRGGGGANRSRIPSLMKTAPSARALLAAILVSTLHIVSTEAAPPDEVRGLVSKRVEAEYPSLFGIYKKLHAQPELFFMEVKTAALVASELRALGFTVTERVGKTGAVGVLKNGAGP